MPVDTMTAEEVAELLKVTPPTVYRWARENTLPSTRMGRTLRFSRRDVEAMMNNGAPAPSSDPEDLVGVIADRVIEELDRRGLVVKR